MHLHTVRHVVRVAIRGGLLIEGEYSGVRIVDQLSRRRFGQPCIVQKLPE